MTTRVVPVDSRRVEQWLTGVRATGVAFAVPAIATTPYWPGPIEQTLAWVVTAFFAVGMVVVWWLNGRVRTTRERRLLSAGATVFDALVVSGYVFTFAFEVPYVTWSLALVLPIAGALRYGARGSLVMAAFAIALFVSQSLLRRLYVDEPMLSAQIYAGGLIALIAGAMAVLVESLDRQNAAYRDQALELAEAHRVRDRLLAVTSHEFRGSLAAIGTSAATVRHHRRRLSNERADRLLGSVEDQVDQLLRLVDDLRLATATGDQSLVLQPSWRDVRGLVETALDAAARHRDGHSVEVYVEPLECQIDHGRVAQVVRNLVENAYKYSPAGTLVTVAVDRSDTGISLRVIDQGPGIRADLRQHLFEPFRRGSDEQATGSGLGLYVVRRIVTAAGGSVDVRSSSAGTTFSVALPCATRPAPTVVTDEAEEA